MDIKAYITLTVTWIIGATVVGSILALTGHPEWGAGVILGSILIEGVITMDILVSSWHEQRRRDHK